MWQISNYRENLPQGTAKSGLIKEIFELQRFQLRKGNGKGFLRKFHGDFRFVIIMEIFKLWRLVVCFGALWDNFFGLKQKKPSHSLYTNILIIKGTIEINYLDIIQTQ